MKTSNYMRFAYLRNKQSLSMILKKPVACREEVINCSLIIFHLSKLKVYMPQKTPIHDHIAHK